MIERGAKARRPSPNNTNKQNILIMNDFNELINGSKPVLVDFYATWCGPCQMQAPILEDVKQRLGDSVSVVKIDVDRNSEAAAMYNVRSIPTLMLFKDGKQLWRGTGLHQAEDLIATVHEHIG
jgi:thioredoxin 1